jgi:hypothetical protein
MIHDDAVMFGSAESLAWATALAGNPGPGSDPIKSIVVSQDAWDLPRRGVRANLNNMGWVGPMTDAGRRYWQTMEREAAADAIADRHIEPYMWSVHDGTELHTFDPVPDDYA